MAVVRAFRIRTAVFVAFLIVLIPSTLPARTIRVPADVPAVENALDLALPHDTVLVAPGEYHPARTLVIGRLGVVLKSEEPLEAILIGADHAWDEGFVWVKGDSCAVEGFIIVPAMWTAISIGDPGGRVDGARIEGNWIYGLGRSGIFDGRASGTKILGNEIEDCMDAIYLSSTSNGILIEGNDIHRNYPAIGLQHGGTIRNNRIHDNINVSDYGAPGSGGGISIYQASESVIIEGNLIEDNVCDRETPEFGEGRGGGIFVAESPDVTIRNNRITGNQAIDGAGIYARQSGLLVEGNLIWANRDSSVYYPANPLRGQGGGLYLLECEGTVERNTISVNIALIEGGAVYQAGSSLALRNNIFAGNRTEGAGVFVAGPPPLAFECNDAWSNGAQNYGGFSDPTGTNGNISLDPIFCVPEDGDFTLRSDSPCAESHAPAGCGWIGALDVGCYAPNAVPEIGGAGDAMLFLSPNPATERVKIMLGAATASSGILRILDAAGREVFAFRFQAGAPGLDWDARRADGRPVPPGVFYVCIESGDLRIAKTLVMLR